MFEPIPNFGKSLPNRVVPILTMRQRAIQRAVPDWAADLPNPFAQAMAGAPRSTVVAPAMQAVEYVPTFGLIRDKAPEVKAAKTRFVPPSYIFMAGRKVSTGPSKRFSGR